MNHSPYAVSSSSEVADRNQRRGELTEEELQREYAERRAALEGCKEYSVCHILLAERPEAEWVINALERGAEFSRLADCCSTDRSGDGGRLGWISIHNCDRAIVDAAIGLSVGSFSRDPVSTRSGWHVLRLDAVRDVQI